MIDFVIAAILLAMVIAAGLYVYRAKRRGAKCIGCPCGDSCGSGGSCGPCGGLHNGEKGEHGCCSR